MDHIYNGFLELYRHNELDVWKKIGVKNIFFYTFKEKNTYIDKKNLNSGKCNKRNRETS